LDEDDRNRLYWLCAGGIDVTAQQNMMKRNSEGSVGYKITLKELKVGIQEWIFTKV
jgi:hypothetical protein